MASMLDFIIIKGDGVPPERVLFGKNPPPLFRSVPFRAASSLASESLPFLASVLLKLPIAIIEWTDGSCLQPSRNTVEVKCVLGEQSATRARRFWGQCCLTLHIPHATVHSSLVADA